MWAVGLIAFPLGLWLIKSDFEPFCCQFCAWLLGSIIFTIFG